MARMRGDPGPELAARTTNAGGKRPAWPPRGGAWSGNAPRSLQYDNIDATLDKALATGYLDPLEPGGFAAYTHRPDEFMAEAAEAGFTAAPPVAIEGPAYFMSDVEERLADRSAWNEVLDAARRIEGVSELVGIGPHLLMTAYASRDVGDVVGPV